ncbi:MAG: sucrase ferredoxin [Marmoricola sp.]
MTPACSTGSLAAGEPLIGSAPPARAWLCLEQPGPWGRKALRQSHLDPQLGKRIERLAERYGVRAALIRRPGRHADQADQADQAGQAGHGSPKLLVAHTHPAGSWLLSGRLEAPEEVLELDWEALAAGEPTVHPRLAVDPEPVLLVCTNGRRDTCCARLGRPVALSAAARRPERVWEVTHTSGHRFAPTTVLLPSGHLHGRVIDAAGLLDLAGSGRLALDGWRGRSTWPEAGQAAEQAVRRTLGVDGLDDLVVADGEAGWLVRHRDGRAWQVSVTSTQSGERGESCGKEPRPIRRFVASVPEPVPTVVG